MTSILGLKQDEVAFLQPFLPDGKDGKNVSKSTPNRPHVTLTYACSLDGLISLSPGVRTTLSGPETKSMTHYLRQHHDAILVGAGTAVADNPSLNCRYPGVTLSRQPRPVIVDPSLRWPIDNASVVQLAREGKGKKPWIACRKASVPSHDTCDDVELLAIDGADCLNWESILHVLKKRGIDSVMIEGGATILNTLLMQANLIDAVIVTVAPTWLGQGGVHVSPAAHQVDGTRHNSAKLVDTAWKQFGADAILCGRLERIA